MSSTTVGHSADGCNPSTSFDTIEGPAQNWQGSQSLKDQSLTTLKIDNMLLKKHFDKSIATQTELRLGENVMIGLTRCRLGGPSLLHLLDSGKSGL